MKESWPNASEPIWCNMLLDGQSVMLGAAVEPARAAEMCAGDAEEARIHTRLAESFQAHAAGVGVSFYLHVSDVDAYDAQLREKGVELLRGEPKTQFYGIRETVVDDPDGYRLIFYSPAIMDSCQSCGMPLANASEGQMYCQHCTDDEGALRSYEQVFEGSVTGFFMAMQKMERQEAEQAAEEHLARMPAWTGRWAQPSETS
jgi:uncharacterized glyoxalase superfamily protein PhnB